MASKNPRQSSPKTICIDGDSYYLGFLTPDAPKSENMCLVRVPGGAALLHEVVCGLQGVVTLGTSSSLTLACTDSLYSFGEAARRLHQVKDFAPKDHKSPIWRVANVDFDSGSRSLTEIISSPEMKEATAVPAGSSKDTVLMVERNLGDEYHVFVDRITDVQWRTPAPSTERKVSCNYYVRAIDPVLDLTARRDPLPDKSVPKVKAASVHVVSLRQLTSYVAIRLTSSYEAICVDLLRWIEASPEQARRVLFGMNHSDQMGSSTTASHFVVIRLSNSAALILQHSTNKKNSEKIAFDFSKEARLIYDRRKPANFRKVNQGEIRGIVALLTGEIIRSLANLDENQPGDLLVNLGEAVKRGLVLCQRYDEVGYEFLSHPRATINQPILRKFFSSLREWLEDSSGKMTSKASGIFQGYQSLVLDQKAQETMLSRDTFWTIGGAEIQNWARSMLWTSDEDKRRIPWLFEKDLPPAPGATSNAKCWLQCTKGLNVALDFKTKWIAKSRDFTGLDIEQKEAQDKGYKLKRCYQLTVKDNNKLESEIVFSLDGADFSYSIDNHGLPKLEVSKVSTTYGRDLDPVEMARQMAKALLTSECADKHIRKLPHFSLGKINAYDRLEIEDYLSIQCALMEYKDSGLERPLNMAVFGPPGAGKSIGITEILKFTCQGAKVFSEKPLVFNLAQFQSLDELGAAFHDIRNEHITGVIPVAVFDEFDCNFAGSKFGWLKYLLAPMQDGTFWDGKSNVRLPRCVLVFAGGVNRRFDEMNARSRDVDFCAAKGPDFISRIRASLNVRGVNKPDPVDDSEGRYLIRRALLLRGLLSGIHKEMGAQPPERFMDQGLANAFLTMDAFNHGTRSVEAILRMSVVERGKMLRASGLPPQSQLNMHVDAKRFLEALKPNPSDFEIYTKLAQEGQ